MAAQRGIRDPDPDRIRRARGGKLLSRKGLADAIEKRLGWRAVPVPAIAKIERGRRVEPALYRPVLIELGLAPEPSLKWPAPKQAPGEWVRELREAYGISPKSFRQDAQYPDSEERLSRDTLNAIETKGRVPSLQMLPAIATGFTGSHDFPRSHVNIDASQLQNAWILFGGEPVVAAWGEDIPDIIKLREKLLVRWHKEQQRVGVERALLDFASTLSNLWPFAQGASDNPSGISNDPAADPPRSAN
jgi:transcriptional regulator with XRE-family HTH domain